VVERYADAFGADRGRDGCWPYVPDSERCAERSRPSARGDLLRPLHVGAGERLAAGELGCGTFVNEMEPEAAAAFLRAACYGPATDEERPLVDQ